MKLTTVEYYLEEESGQETRVTGDRLLGTVSIDFPYSGTRQQLSAYDVDKLTEALDNAAAFAVVR